MPRVRVLKRTVIYQGHVIRLIRETLEFNGKRIIRETVQHPGAVVIIPMLSRSRIVFVRQYRRAIDRELLELPAGTLGPGEHRRGCAQRELQEETGWRASSLRQVGQFYAAPGAISEQLTIFLAQGLRYVGANPDADECIEPVILTMQEALRRIWAGTLCDSKSIIGVLMAQRLLAPPRRKLPRVA